MNIATLLFTGSSMPYHVLDYAISWARENEGSLHALFVVPGHVPPEGYPFPNDIDEAENLTTEVDADKGIRQILKQHTRYIEKRANASHVPVNTDILFSPTIEQVLTRINQTDTIFIDKVLEDNPATMEELSFSLEELRNKSSRHFEPVGEYDRYSDTFY